MAHSSKRTFLRQFRALYDLGTCAGLSDGQLLERFATRGGEAAELAFAVLVERHGPMVLRICRRVLSDPHDADDAFQAVFLVLVRRAGSIRKRESVASWLHGVAVRVAGAARSAEGRRRRHERGAALRTPAPVEDELVTCERGVLLHEEIGRIPDRYRAAVVLCYLEGRTYDEASRLVGCPVGTVKSRLAAARELLGARLARRGFAPLTGALAGILAAEVATAAVPRALAEATVRTAARLEMGKAALAGTVPAAVAVLTEGGMGMMASGKLWIALVFVLSFGIAGAGAVVLAQQNRKTENPQSVETAADEKKADTPALKLDPSARAADSLQVLRPKLEPRRRTIEQMLDEPVSFDSDDHPTLGDAIRFLADRTALQIVVDPKGLDNADVSVDSKVYLLCHDLKLKTVLRMLLRPLRLTYLVEDNLVLVTSVSGRQAVISRHYRVDDLVRGSSREDGETAKPTDALFDVVEIIRSSVAPGTWTVHGGKDRSPQSDSGTRTLGTIIVYPLNLSFVAVHEEQIHVQIEKRLAQLRRLQSGRDSASDSGTGKIRDRAPARAVFVPTLASEHLSEREAHRVTESLMRAIVESTPYKIVGSPGQADLRLEWSLVAARETKPPAR